MDAKQPLFGGARRGFEFRLELFDERLPVEGQRQALVRRLLVLPPVLVVVDQVPERDMLAALRQEQAAGAQCVANGKGERDFPDATVELLAGLAVRDQMGAPVRLYEAVRIVRRQGGPGAGIEGALDFYGPEQWFAPRGGLEGQGEEGRQVLAQRAVARLHGIEVAAGFEPFIGAARHRGFHKGRRAQRIAERIERLPAIGRNQLVDGAEHALQAVAGAALQGLALLLHGIARQPVHVREKLIVHFDNLIDQRLAGF